ncbi:MAG: hypothetical protein J5747_01850 [Spirochaetaceae bacterium]|nr:hypothetical protein [Spirochaetaceae bacterium]
MNEKIKAIWDKCISFLVEQWETNRTIVLASAALLICIPLILIVVIGLGGSKNDAPVSGSASEIEEYIYLPAEPEMGNDFILSRNKQSEWSEEEANRWFVEPDEKMMNDVRSVNDRMINELLEAVP